ncbi:hypothetical protein [Actinomadura chokoriensis]|uniref:hypothetical protein n=1 Tax=Actinomadura chokoriensis TaxID=454156 RepID=UPI0031F9913A
MWQFVLWGVAGAVAHRTYAFLDVNRGRKKWPLRSPEGPDGRYYLIACVLHCLLAALVTAAAAANDQITTSWQALALGVGTPSVLAKLSRYALQDAPPAADGEGSAGPAREGAETDAA